MPTLEHNALKNANNGNNALKNANNGTECFENAIKGIAHFKNCKQLFEYQHLLLLRGIWWLTF
jgi:hypothetical protein